MKFEVECLRKNRVKTRDIACVMDKMYAIEDNLKDIISLVRIQDQYGDPSSIFLKAPISTLVKSVTSIGTGDTEGAWEFWIEFEDLKGINSGEPFTLSVGIESKVGAIGEELIFMLENESTFEELQEYKLGKTNSFYTKMGNSEYYFKIL